MMHAMPAQPNTLNVSTLANFVDPLPILSRQTERNSPGFLGEIRGCLLPFRGTARHGQDSPRPQTNSLLVLRPFSSRPDIRNAQQ